MTAHYDGDSRPMWLRKAMREVTRRSDEAKTESEKMYWGAVWWRLHARTSANPAEPLSFSRECLRRSRELAQSAMTRLPPEFEAAIFSDVDSLYEG